MYKDNFKLIKLPYRTRNVKKLVMYLRPVKLLNNIFVWNVEREGRGYYCVVFGENYRVVFEDRIESDVLSGLKFKLRIPKGMVDSKIVWEAKWIKSMFVVNEVRCDHIVKSLDNLYGEDTSA